MLHYLVLKGANVNARGAYHSLLLDGLKLIDSSRYSRDWWWTDYSDRTPLHWAAYHVRQQI